MPAISSLSLDPTSIHNRKMKEFAIVHGVQCIKQCDVQPFICCSFNFFVAVTTVSDSATVAAPHLSELTAQHPEQQQQAAIALPLLAAHSMRAMASYRHFVMSNNATTSPFRTTGKCLNLPAPSTFLSSASCHLLQKTPRQTSIK
jgi:hypothetical protein